jgi:hypothetical protein
MSTLIKLLKIVKKLLKQRREAAIKLQQLEAFLEANGWERINQPNGEAVRSQLAAHKWNPRSWLLQFRIFLREGARL